MEIRVSATAIEKNCLNCIRCESVLDVRTGMEWHRCLLDRDMRVNRRMHCEDWTGMVTTKPDGKGGCNHGKDMGKI